MPYSQYYEFIAVNKLEPFKKNWMVHILNCLKIWLPEGGMQVIRSTSNGSNLLVTIVKMVN